MKFYKIKLFGVIASEMESMFFGDEDMITLKKVESYLKEANGDDIEVDLSSVGGRVDVGSDIFFAFRDYKRQFPKSQMILNIKSQAASMASFLAAGEFWDIITVEDISSWMNHNPANYVGGDYRVMKENATYLERLAVLYSGAYQKRSKKSEKEIRAMMDKTTWLYGQEIVDAGFADEVLASSDVSDDEKNKDAMIAKTVLKYDSMMDKMQQVKMRREDLQKAVASITNMEKPAMSGNNNSQEEVVMTFDEAKKTFSSELAVVEKAGEEKGKTEMIANNKAIMELKAKPEFKNLSFIQERCDEALMKGENLSDVKMAINAMLLDPKNQAHMESPGDINAGSSGTMSGEKADKSAEVKW